jgi:phosphotriesterase-related protein
MSQRFVRTVLGPVPERELGYTDAHSHLWIDPVPGTGPVGPILEDKELILRGLTAYRQAGGQAIVDCQPGGCGRNANRLARLAALSNISVIACTGFHRRLYYAPDHNLWAMSAREAGDFFIDEIQNGLVETRTGHRLVKPGFIKIAAEKSLEESPKALFEGAAAAFLATGLAIEMHTEQGAATEEFLTFFIDQGVPANRLVFCHMDKRPDPGLHSELAEAGILLEYDTFFRPKYQPDRYLWPLLSQMLEAGYGTHIALATDMASHRMWQRPGPDAFLTYIKPCLETQGVDPKTLQQLLGGNITGRLAMREQ